MFRNRVKGVEVPWRAKTGKRREVFGIFLEVMSCRRLLPHRIQIEPFIGEHFERWVWTLVIETIQVGARV